MTAPTPPTDPWGNPLPAPAPPAAPPPPPPPGVTQPPGVTPPLPPGAPGPPGTAPRPTAPADWWGDGATAPGDVAAAPPRPGTPPLAVWALVSAVAGFLFCGVVLGPLAVVLGFLARQQVRTQAASGEGLAIAAMVIGVAAFVVNVVVIAVLLTNPDLMDTP